MRASRPAQLILLHLTNLIILDNSTQCIYLLTHSIVQDILCKVDSHSVCQTTACILYGTQKFITVFTKPGHWILFRAIRIQFAPSIPISLTSIIFKFQISIFIHLSVTLCFQIQICSPKPVNWKSYTCFKVCVCVCVCR
jgi:hypothetical protein